MSNDPSFGNSPVLSSPSSAVRAPIAGPKREMSVSRREVRFFAGTTPIAAPQSIAGRVGVAFACLLFAAGLLSGLPVRAQTPDPSVAEMNASARFVIGNLSSRLNIREAPSVTAPILGRERAGASLGNAGCETHDDRLWCAVTGFDQSGQQGWAAAEFLIPVTVRSRARRGEFDQIGRLDCVPAGEPVETLCEYGVARDPDGSAALIVYLSADEARLLYWDGTDLTLEGDGTDALAKVSGPDDVLILESSFGRLDVPGSVLTGETR